MNKLVLNSNLIIVLYFTLACPFSFANKQKGYYKNFENAEVRLVTTFYDNEIVNNIYQIGELCNQYLELMRSKTFVSLDFYYYPNSHKYINKYLLGYEKLGNGKKGIVITIAGNNPDLKSIFKLVEFSINNTSFIKSAQKKSGEFRYKSYSLEKERIDSILDKSEINETAESILSKRIIQMRDSFNLVYYYQNDKFYFFNRIGSYKDLLLTLDNIYKICDLDLYHSIVFDSDTSFYYFDLEKNEVSKKNLIPTSELSSYYDLFATSCLGNIYVLRMNEQKKMEFILYITKPQKIEVKESSFFNCRENLNNMFKIRKITGNSFDVPQLVIE